MYVQFNDMDKEHSLRNLTYIHVSNGSFDKAISVSFDEYDSALVADLEALMNTGVHKIVAIGDSGTEIYRIEGNFKVDSLQDSLNEDARRDLNLRLVPVV